MGVDVLVADDDAVICSMVEGLLTKSGFSVTVVNDGAQAVETALARKFDLLITDIMMPEIEGIEVIAEVINKWPNCKIIAISSEGTVGFSSFLDIAKAVGATETIKKPFTPDELRSAIRQVGIHIS